MNKTRVLIIEDNRLYGDGMAALLNSQPDIKAIALGSIHDVVVREAVDFKPHVVLLDQKSFGIVPSIREEISRMHVIVTDLVPGTSQVLWFVRRGVSGFLHRDASANDCLSTIRSVAKGQKVIPPDLFATLFAQIFEEADCTDNPDLINRANHTTPRETEIRELVALGRCNKEIAQELDLSVHTVKSHIHNMLKKLALRTRVELAHHVIRNRRARSLSDAPLPAGLLNPRS